MHRCCRERAIVRNPPNNRHCQTSQKPNLTLKHQHTSPKWKCYLVKGKLTEVIPSWGCASVADFLLSMPEVLSSLPSHSHPKLTKLHKQALNCDASHVNLRRGGGGKPSPHTLPIEKITILRTDAITRLGSRNTGPLEFSWLGTCSTWASVS